MDADGLLGHFVGTNVEDVLAHVEVGSFILERLVAALHEDPVALFKCQKQDLFLDGAHKYPLEQKSNREGFFLDGVTLTSEEHQS